MAKYEWEVLRWLTPNGSLRVGRIDPVSGELVWKWIMVPKR